MNINHENNVDISILVPVYKVESFISRCIDSVITQNLTNYELILVDDGSPDNSGIICEEYAHKYPFIRVIHKANGGLPSARLTGFQKAKGKYIMFLDSDDFLLPNALSTLYNKIEEGYDIVKGCNWRFHQNDNYYIESYPSINKSINNPESYLIALLKYEIPPYLWGGLYKKDLFNDEIFNKVQKLSVCEDWITNLLIWKKVYKYYIIKNPVYSYYINPKSIMQSRIISYPYVENIYSIIEKDISSEISNESIYKYFITAKTISYIKLLFTPEIKWNNAIYIKIRRNISSQTILNTIKKQIDNKFLLFIRHKYIYIIYCFLYKVLFKLIKLNGKRRKVIS